MYEQPFSGRDDLIPARRLQSKPSFETQVNLDDEFRYPLYLQFSIFRLCKLVQVATPRIFTELKRLFLKDTTSFGFQEDTTEKRKPAEQSFFRATANQLYTEELCKVFVNLVREPPLAGFPSCYAICTQTYARMVANARWPY